MKRILRCFLPVIVWFFVIAFVCFAPLSGGSRLLNIKHLDKVIHFSIFFIFSIFIFYGLIAAFNKYRPVFFALTAILPSLAYAAVTELVQSFFLPSRTGDPWDMLADSAGIILAVSTALLINRRRLYLHNEESDDLEKR